MILMINAICSASIEINDSRSTADYWINRSVDVNKILMTREEIEEFNKNILSRDKFASDLKNYPMKLSASKVNELIKLGEYKTYSGNHNINFDVNVRYAVTVERGDIRLQPTYFNGDNYDSHQGTAIDPCEAVAVLIESPDKKFLFVQSRNYLGWIDKNKIAFTDRQTWQNYINPKQFIVVTANKKIIEVYDKKYLFQMGAKIPVIFVKGINKTPFTKRMSIIKNLNITAVLNSKFSVDMQFRIMPHTSTVSNGCKDSGSFCW